MPLGKAGVGSAMNDTTRELGGALGVAVLGSVVTSSTGASLGAVAGLPEQARPAAESGLTGAVAVAGQLGASRAPSSSTPPSQAFVDGMGWPPSSAPSWWPWRRC